MRTPVIVFLSLLVAASAAAPETAIGLAHETRQNVRENVQEQRGDVRKNVQAERETLRQNLQEQREVLRREMSEERDAFKAEVEQKREALQARIKTERDQLKERLKTVRDERKKAAVERIDAEIARLNERMVKHFTAVLDKLADLLGRVSTRASKAEERGLNVSAVRTAITAAETAIANARAAVSAQAGKTYRVTISTEAALKADVGKTRQALQADLKSVREAIRLAHDAVRKAATTLAQIPRVDEATPPAATSTAPAEQ